MNQMRNFKWCPSSISPSGVERSHHFISFLQKLNSKRLWVPNVCFTQDFNMCHVCLLTVESQPASRKLYENLELSSLVIVFQSLSYARLFETPWTAACQTSLSFTISWSLLKLMSIESVMSSHHLILCHPLLLLSSPVRWA